MAHERLVSLNSSQGVDEASSSSSIVASQPSLFGSSKVIDQLDLPEDLLDLIAAHLENKELIKLSRANRASYFAFYPTIKAAMLKTLKELVKEDDTLKVSQLLKTNPNLQLRTDGWDPQGKAYEGIETTPYQDALA